MKYIKKMFTDPNMYNEVEFGKKIHEDNVLLKIMQEILPEEHIVSVGFRFPEDKDNQNVFAKTADGETIIIGLLVADEETWPSGLNYFQNMLKDEVYRFMRNELLLCRTYFILLTPVDPWKNGREKYTISFRNEESEELTEMLKSRLVVVCPEN